MKNYLNIIIDEADFSPIVSQKQMDGFSLQDKELAQKFLDDKWQALFELGLEKKIDFESAPLSFLQQVATDFITDLVHQPRLEELREKVEIKPSKERLEALLSRKPFVKEAGYITKAWLENIYAHLNQCFGQKIASYPGSVKKFFNEFNEDLNLAESIFFHLVENPKGGPYPFAFLATYAKKLNNGRIRHVPLADVLEEYQTDRSKIMELLSCLIRVSEVSPLISKFMVSGELFHPLGLSADEAYTFLKAVPDLEKLGIVCRIPNWWKKKSNSIFLNIKIGEEKPSLFGLDSLISLKPILSVDDQKLTKADIRKILETSEGLILIKGKWVEASPKKLQALLDLMEKLPKEVTLQEALQQEIHFKEQDILEDEDTVQLSHGKWLQDHLQKLSNPSIICKTSLPKGFNATLRPYQVEGYNWLNALSKLGFGALLADDMGLGKTIQTLAWLAKEYQKDPKKKALLIVPASLLGNWKKEAKQFAPNLSLECIHSRPSIEKFEHTPYKDLPFLNVTTYGMAIRLEKLKEYNWDFLILDEAQAIKNPGTKQSQLVKNLKAHQRLAMTGTPIENNLINLWSIFDFLNRGLLGTSSDFQDFIKKTKEEPELLNQLQTMISPFFLRRLKSDKSIISDLPDKIEQNDYIELSEKQKILYGQVIEQLEQELIEKKEKQEAKNLKPFQSVEDLDEDDLSEDKAPTSGRTGLVLGALIKLKQICNHPDQYLGQKEYAFEESGKFKMLKEICDSIRDNHECVLVFTQFREMVEPLNQELEKIFGAKGLVIDGQTPVAEREKIVEAFNKQNTYIPYIVLSLRAAGVGLNLTRANHVIHFDRWWNPAVENQATDRAYRIGQHKNVIVHKFVCLQTLEEKIDEMIQSKQDLADSIIQGSSESWLTSLSDQELLDTLRIKL